MATGLVHPHPRAKMTDAKPLIFLHKETALPFSKSPGLSSTNIDWQVISKAQNLASACLQRHPKDHEHSQRLARSIVDLYRRGISDPGVLSTLAINREKALEIREQKDMRVAKRLEQQERRKAYVQKQSQPQVE